MRSSEAKLDKVSRDGVRSAAGLRVPIEYEKTLNFYKKITQIRQLLVDM